MPSDSIKYKKLSSLALPIMMMIPTIIGLFLLLMMLIYGEVGRTLFTDIICIIMLGIFPIFLTIMLIIVCWKTVEITEKGVKSSLFGKFFRRELKWEEINEVRAIFIPVGGAWVYLSKSSVEGMKIKQASKQKDNIYVMYSKKLHKVILHYYEKGIINIDSKLVE